MDSGRGGRTSRSLPPSSSIPDSSIFNDITNLSPVRPCNDSSSPLPPLDHVFGSPRHNSQRGSNFSQRPQKPGSADAEQSLRENSRPKILSATQGVSGPSTSQLAVHSITRIHDHESKVSTVVQPHSSSEGVNELLADPPKGSDRFTQSPNLLSSRLSKMSQNNIRGTTDEVLVDDNVEKDMDNEMAPTTTLPKEVEEVPKDKESCSLGNPTAKGDGESSGRQADEDPADLLTSNLSTQSTLGKQNELHSVDEAATTTAPSMTNTEPGIVKHEERKSFSSSGFHQLGIEDHLQVKKSTQPGDCDHAPELLPETFDCVQFHDVHNENERTMNNQTMENQVHNECKAPDQHHRGIRRRCLQFEGVEAGKKSIGISSRSWNPANIVHNAVAPVTPLYANVLNAMHAETNVSSRNKRLANLQHHTSRLPIYPCRMLESHIDNIDISAGNNRESMITGPLPPSIGLHLNRTGNSVAANCGLNVKLTGKDYLSFPGEKSPSASIRHLAENSMGQLAPVNSFGNSLEKSTAKSESSLAYSVHINIEVGQDESQHSMTANSSNISQTANQMNSWNSSQHLILTDQHELLHESKRTGSQDVYALDEFKQMSRRKKRKEDKLSVEIESCKRCNCKKSKCLKLYCDCFAAGVYCVDSCSCQECLNRIEYEDTVFATRQQIESRNPLAFAPKIVRRVADSPQSSREDSNWTTAASARHKRGCNCKKSMCLKKYCECYQAGVGCCDGCRCEGCKNIFGKKEGSGEAMEMENRQVVDRGFVDSFSDDKIIMPETQDYVSYTGQYISDPSLLAPLYQCSNQDRILSAVQHPSGGHPTLSPQLDSSFLSQGNLNSGEMFLKGIKENAAVTPYYPELHYFEPETTNMLSPKLKGFSDMYSFVTSDQYAQPMSSFSGGRYPLKASQTTMCHPSALPPASSFYCPSSTFYPNLHSLGHKLVLDTSLDGTPYNILEGQHPIKLEDMHSTMPEKATSANEKHGSPPTNCLEELSRTLPLPGLRDSRKPIPKSLSFPPQTDKIPE